MVWASKFLGGLGVHGLGFSSELWVWGVLAGSASLSS